MSSNSNYRDGRRDFRGGGYNNNSRGRGGGGRGGGFNKPRRYWDNDDPYDKDHEGGGRRRYSRSKSRSYSRSKSRSRTPERRRRNTDDQYEPKNPTGGLERGGGVGNEPYEPYIPQPPLKPLHPQNSSSWKVVDAANPAVHPQANGGGRGLITPGSLPDGYASAENIQRIQQMHQQFQLHQKQQLDDPSLTYGGYGTGQNSKPSQLYGGMDMTGGLQITKPEQGEDLHQHHHSSSSKKKKEKKKKKKSRRRSSSSSSSSSDDSSSESKKKKKSKRKDSDESSDSSSGNDEEKTSDKKEKTPGLTKQQKEALLVQKESYSKKLELLEREIDKLRTKEDELRNTGSRVDGKLIDDNLKLQAELKGRCKAVLIVLEKINDVLQVDKSAEEKRVPPPPPKLSQSSKTVQESQPQIKKDDYSMLDFFDNGQHWCRLCNVFPETIEKMLGHFHSQAHQDQVEQLGIDDKPWHKRDLNQDKPTSAPPGARKAPFKGMQFFSPVEGWYCRLCNIWMGDAHCATEHLKSGDHNSNYMTFLEEHPDWEGKWGADREKARIRAGLAADSTGNAVVRKSRFEDARGQLTPAVFDETVGSIRVQMRNTHQKVEDPVYGPSAQAGVKHDSSGIDEWMGKPASKVPVDIIDTQKFAEIVRQKHGAKIKEDELRSGASVPTVPEISGSRPSSAQHKDKGDLRDMLRREEGGRRQERVEMQPMQVSSRDTNREREIRDMRDRYHRDNRDRGGGGGRRRSRSRSRSRERDRDRGYHGRRRSRSRSRSRDRRVDRDSGRRDRVEAVKKLPMIGKMPLYKRPLTAKDAGKEKSSEHDKDKDTGSSKDSSKRGDSEGRTANQQGLTTEESNLSNPSDNNSLSAYGTGTSGFGGVGQSPSSAAAHMSTFDGSLQAYGGLGLSGGVDSSVYVPVETADNDLKPPGEKEAPGGTNLPDDLQQALDIIYKGGGKPITVPPPNMPGIPTGVPPPGLPPTNIPPPSATGYGDYGAYMGYEPYQMSFEGYGPPPGFEDMEEVVTAPPGTVEQPAPSSAPVATPATAAASDEKPPGEENEEDDMDDLRMLGIDVDDVAVVVRR